MNYFSTRSECLLLIAIFCLLILTSQGSRPECLNNNLQPDQEEPNGTVNTELNDFLVKLEKYTGLSKDDPHVVDVDCPTNKCGVNPNGTLIWDARMDFYNTFMMDSIASNDTNVLRISLDGCLCYSDDSTDYISCMKQLRKKMTDGLDDTLIPQFVSAVEANGCALFSENCI